MLAALGEPAQYGQRCQGGQGPSGLKEPRGDLWAHVPCVLLGCAMDTAVKV